MTAPYRNRKSRDDVAPLNTRNDSVSDAAANTIPEIEFDPSRMPFCSVHADALTVVEPRRASTFQMKFDVDAQSAHAKYE
jgi:hypothetical protein